MKSITINRKHLVALLNCAGKDDIRYYLNGVCIDFSEKGIILITTDGSKMAMLRIDESPQEAQRMIIPRHIVELISKDKKLIDTVLTSLCDGKWCFDNAISFNEIDGKFPDFWRVIPRDNTGAYAHHFQSENILAFEKIAKVLNKNSRPSFKNHLTCASVQIKENNTFFGVVMPITQKDCANISWI